MNSFKVKPWDQIGGSMEYDRLENKSEQRRSGISARGELHFIDIPSGREVFRRTSSETKQVASAIKELFTDYIFPPKKSPEQLKKEQEAKEKKAIEFRSAQAKFRQLEGELEKARYEARLKEVLRIAGGPITQEQMATAGFGNTSFDAKNIDGIGKISQIAEFRRSQIEKQKKQAQSINSGRRSGGVDLRQASANEGGSALSSQRAA